MFKVNNKDTRTTNKVNNKDTRATPMAVWLTQVKINLYN